jgi:hypothetical protein
MHTRCAVCAGKKVIMGLGSMLKECSACDGIGHVTVVISHDKNDEQENVTTTKKRGRPKQNAMD